MKRARIDCENETDVDDEGSQHQEACVKETYLEIAELAEL